MDNLEPETPKKERIDLVIQLATVQLKLLKVTAERDRLRAELEREKSRPITDDRDRY